jgi:predicted nucleotidyltransferase/predicted transcriptional regulator with HTH domain
MLNIITKSKVRQGILKLLFSNENQEYYLSEVAKKIKTSVGTTQRELNKLINSEIIITEKKANIRYYRLNKKNPLYPELNKIVLKTIGLEAELSRLIKPVKKIKFAFIFGSYVNEGFKSGSDIDLFIIGSPDENTLLKKVRQLEKSIERDINYHISALTEFRTKLKKNSFVKNIINNYILLTGDHEEFKRILKSTN